MLATDVESVCRCRGMAEAVMAADGPGETGYWWEN